MKRLTGLSTSFAPPALLVFLLSAVISSCYPRTPLVDYQEGAPYVSFPRDAIPADELREGTLIMLGVFGGGEPPWSRLSLRVPNGVIIINESRNLLRPGQGPKGVRWLEFNPSQIVALPPSPGVEGVDWLQLEMRHWDPPVGEVLSFPATVMFSDSLMLQFHGPPGSERPAPKILVTEPRMRFGKIGRGVGWIIAEAAFWALILAWLYRRRLRRR